MPSVPPYRRLMEDIQFWWRDTFGSTVLGTRETWRDVMQKLYEETRELDEAIEEGQVVPEFVAVSADMVEELADVFICVVAMSEALGVSLEEFMSAVYRKHLINERRTWARDENGVMRHV